jgi:hypothetical protein
LLVLYRLEHHMLAGYGRIILIIAVNDGIRSFIL